MRELVENSQPGRDQELGPFHSSGNTSDRIQVVLVDDDRDFVSLASTLLESESESLEITTYTDPRAALDRIDFHEIDCIVSDYRMPEMGGIEFLEEIREDHPKLPFILFTGKGDEDIAKKAISAGVSDYMIKDGSSEQYAISANRIENLVRQYRTRKRWARQQILDALSRSVFEVVLNERSQEAIEQGVCDRISASERYSFAWIGEQNPRTGRYAAARVRVPVSSSIRSHSRPIAIVLGALKSAHSQAGNERSKPICPNPNSGPPKRTVGGSRPRSDTRSVIKASRTEC